MPRTEIRTYDAQSKTQSGIICVVEDGRLVEVRPDPDHPNGPHEIELDPKSRVLPELLYHPDRLKYPVRRTKPKTSSDPGWERITWDEALDAIAAKLLEIRDASGAEAVDFHRASPGGAASIDYNTWFHRLAFSFGSPNISSAMYICNWHKDFASRYTYGSGIAEPDFEQTACMVLWGHNPENTWRGHYRSILRALDRGAKFIVVDPRRIPLADKADLWLPVRPGTDGCLALGMLQVLLSDELFDPEFARTWTTGPFAIREDTGRFLREIDLDPEGGEDRFMVWDEERRTLRAIHPLEDLEALSLTPALSAAGTAPFPTGETVAYRTAWDHLVEAAGRTPLDEVSRITGVPEDDIRRAARMLATVKPSSYYTYNGVEQHPNATQTNRAISVLFSLTGQIDAPGANVAQPSAGAMGIAGVHLLPPGGREKNLARERFPLGPPGTTAHIPPYEVFRAILTGKPYPIRAIVSFGGNILLSTCDTLEGQKALEKLEFFVLAELFETPVARFADILLPASTFLESIHVKAGFQGTDAPTFVQLRKRIVPPLHESRPDMEIIFELAKRLGLGDQFWDGDIRAAFDAQLAPTGLSVKDLEENPAGIQVDVPVKHHKYREPNPETGRPRGFKTATGRVELYLESFLEKGQPPTPKFEPPLPAGADDPESYTLTMITAKVLEFCHGQHRAIPSLRKLRPDPQVDIHPRTAGALGVSDGEWVRLKTPQGSVRVRARVTDAIRLDVVCTQHGWWQECKELELPGYDAFSESGANLNRIIGSGVVDPVSGATPNRSSRCRIERLDG